MLTHLHAASPERPGWENKGRAAPKDELKPLKVDSRNSKSEDSQVRRQRTTSPSAVLTPYDFQRWASMQRIKTVGSASPCTVTAAAPSSCFPPPTIPLTSQPASQAPAGWGPSLQFGLASLSSFDLSPAAVREASAGLGGLVLVPLPALSRRAQPFTNQECLFKIIKEKKRKTHIELGKP